MPNKDTMSNATSNDHKGSALLTLNLIDHSRTPDAISDAILETLIDLSGTSRINIWHAVNGINLDSLAALYSMYETGAGYRRVRLYGEYEAGRFYLKRKR